MRFGITLEGGFSPGPSKIFSSTSSLVAMIFRNHQNADNPVRAKIADINSTGLALRPCLAEGDNDDIRFAAG